MKGPGKLGRLLVTMAVVVGARAAWAQETPAANARIVGYYFAPTVRTGFPVDSIDGERLTFRARPGRWTSRSGTGCPRTRRT